MSGRRRRVLYAGDDNDDDDVDDEVESGSDDEDDADSDCSSPSEESVSEDVTDEPQEESEEAGEPVSVQDKATSGKKGQSKGAKPTRFPKSPDFVPRSSRFFLHDDRGGKGGQKRSDAKSKKLASTEMAWKHDKFDELEQLESLEISPSPKGSPRSSSRNSGGQQQHNRKSQSRRGQRGRGGKLGPGVREGGSGESKATSELPNDVNTSVEETGLARNELGRSSERGARSRGGRVGGKKMFTPSKNDGKVEQTMSNESTTVQTTDSSTSSSYQRTARNPAAQNGSRGRGRGRGGRGRHRNEVAEYNYGAPYIEGSETPPGFQGVAAGYYDYDAYYPGMPVHPIMTGPEGGGGLYDAQQYMHDQHLYQQMMAEHHQQQISNQLKATAPEFCPSVPGDEASSADIEVEDVTDYSNKLSTPSKNSSSMQDGRQQQPVASSRPVGTAAPWYPPGSHHHSHTGHGTGTGEGYYGGHDAYPMHQYQQYSSRNTAGRSGGRYDRRSSHGRRYG